MDTPPFLHFLSIPMLLGALFTTGLLQYINYSTVTRDMIAYQLKLIHKILKMEKIWSYLFGPFAGPLGYMAILAFKYKTLDQIILNNPNLLYVLLALAFLVLPMNYLGSMMNKYAFAKDVERLSANLKELEG